MTSDNYEVCPVCFWEDDPVQNEDPQYSSGANSVSLERARSNYVKMCASQREFVNKVRPPTPEEMPTLRILSGLEKEEQLLIYRQVKIHVLVLIRAMLNDHIKVLDGCVCVAMMALQAEPTWQDKLRLFESVAIDYNEFPCGSVRQEWELDALKRSDLELARYTDHIREVVLSECRELEKF